MTQEDKKLFLRTLYDKPLIQAHLLLQMKKNFKFAAFKAILVGLLEHGFIVKELQIMRKTRGKILWRITDAGRTYLAELEE